MAGLISPTMKKSRFWEIDALRGLAVVLMLVSNFLFDLSFFATVITADTFFLNWLARITAGLFILLAGVSLHLKYAASGRNGFKRNLLRGVRLFGLGMVVTVATRIVVGEGFVVFGILHLIGLGLILVFPFLQRRWLSLLAAGAVFALTPLVSSFKISSPWLVWLGIQYDGFYSVDYVPVIPWFGLMLLGVFGGAIIYPQRQPLFAEPLFADVFFWRSLRFLGCHSLFVYFIHQPVFFGGLALVRWLR